MSRRANRVAIGAFVLGGAVVLVIALLVVGAGQLWRRGVDYVLFFQGSQSGLNVGASVGFRGVKIGTVTDILVQYDAKTGAIQIPVIISIEPQRFTVAGGEGGSIKIARETIADFVAHGLRARLRTESLITGLLSVDFDFRPDMPATLVGAYPKLPELPTIPSSTEELSRRLRAIPIEEIADQTLVALRHLDKLVTSSQIPESARSVTEATQALRAFVEDLRAQSGPALRELASAARAFRALADYLERHPEALIRGKGAAGEK